MTKIDIFSGFLGAGKTTLIKKLIQEAYKNEKVILIENEFGEIGIDKGFLQDSGIEIKEMNSGCICCSLVGDFSTALTKVVNEYAPDRILIEPSGVGKLSDVIKAVGNVKEHADITLNSFVCVVDAKKCKMYMKNFKEFFADQIANAKTILLSRTDEITESKLEECLHIIKDVNDKATVITTSWDALTGEKIVEVMEEEVHELMEDICPVCGHEHHHEHDEHCECGHDHHHEHDEHCECGHEHHHEHDEHCECGHDHHHEHDEHCECGHEHHHEHDEHCECGHEHHHHHADDVFTSLGFETIHKYTKEELETILAKLSGEDYGTILRAKGIVASNDSEWYHFDFVPEEYEVRNGHADYTGRICVIGTDLQEEKIRSLFTK